MKRFELPKIEIKEFAAENIVTASGPTSAAAQKMAAELKAANSGIKSVNVVKWTF